MSSLILKNTSTSSIVTPPAGETAIFIDDSVLKLKNSSGTVFTPGGVTSVAFTSTDLNVTGGPITNAGTINIGLKYTPLNRAGDTMTGALILSGTPTTNLQAATKQYVDSTVTSILKPTPLYARVAVTVANSSTFVVSGLTATWVVTWFTSTLTIDGVPCSVGDRIFIPSITNASQNTGIWQIDNASYSGTSVWTLTLTRPNDFDDSSEIIRGRMTYITTGTALSRSLYINNNAGTGTIIVGTTGLTWSRSEKALAPATPVNISSQTTLPITQPLLLANSLRVSGTITASNMFIGTTAASYLTIPQISTTTSYTATLADSAYQIYNAATASSVAITIPANSVTAFPIGTQLFFVNPVDGSTATIVCNDTMRLSPGGTTGTRTLAAAGNATALKVATTNWLIYGDGLT